MSKPVLNLDKVRIRATGGYVPATVCTNHQLADRVSTSPDWIEQTLGIVERRLADAGEFSSDLAAMAGLQAIENAGLDKNDIDLILLATATPDRRSPSTACLAQAKMGITNHCPAMDIAAVCTGFLYSLTIGAQFVQHGAYNRVLVIGADTFSKITDWDHRNCVFFGDGAGAVVLDRNDNPGGLFSSLLYADGTGSDHFTVYPEQKTFTMNGRAVYETATEVLPRAILEVLARNNLSVDDVSLVVPHQPSIKVLKRTAEVLGLPFERVPTNMRMYANTAGATIPLLLHELNSSGRISKGDLLVFAAVGSGWTWGAALYRWS